MKRRKLFLAVDFSKYKGKCVAIVGGKIVASGQDAAEVWLEASRKHPHTRPELLKVTKGETLVLS